MVIVEKPFHDLVVRLEESNPVQTATDKLKIVIELMA